MRVTKIISRNLLLILVSIMLLGCEQIVNMMAFHPDNKDVIPSDKLPSGVEEFSVMTKDSVRITNLYLPVAEANRVVIYFHGNAGNIYQRIDSLLKLQNFALNVIGVSYRGYGKSKGKPSEEGIYQDGKAVLQYARETLGFDDKNIIIFGRSIGSTVAINTAQNNMLGGLILVTPLTSGAAMAKAMKLGFISFLAGNSFDNLTKIKNVAIPVLVIHGKEDRTIPYSMGREIFATIKSKKNFITIEGASHNDLNYYKQYWTSIHNFIK